MKKLFIIIGIIGLTNFVNAQTFIGDNTTKVYQLSIGELAYKTVKNDTVFVTYEIDAGTRSKIKADALKDQIIVNRNLINYTAELKKMQKEVLALKKDSVKMSEVITLYE